MHAWPMIHVKTMAFARAKAAHTYAIVQSISPAMFANTVHQSNFLVNTKEMDTLN